MSHVTVAQFAETLKIPVSKLLKQLSEAGVSARGADDLISDDAKLALLAYLRREHGHDLPQPHGNDDSGEGVIRNCRCI
jgi:translation initiation factor IF-2